MAAAASADSDPSEDDPIWVMARRGIKLMINNEADEAVALFRRYPDSLPMFAGYSFCVFMDALLSLEEDKLNLALSTLRETEHRCAAETGWLKSVHRKMFGSDHTQKTSLADTLETQIILADSQVCIALLTFLQQDIAGYFKGGWVLRKSWKVYQHTYKEISKLYTQIVGEARLPGKDQTDCFSQSAVSTLDLNGEDQFMDYSASQTEIVIPAEMSPSTVKAAINGEQIDRETVTRLMGAVSFGYGLFQLGVSLLPHSLLKLSSFLGFGGNKQGGIECLMYARTCNDMRAPLATLSILWYNLLYRPYYYKRADGKEVLADVDDTNQGIYEAMYANKNAEYFLSETRLAYPLAKESFCCRLALLWYHTIIRPFYALDGRNVQAGVEESEMLINESVEFENSALFLFFRGRVHRLKSEIPLALAAFQQSVNNASQREIKVLSMHEVAWCRLIQLEYKNAELAFQQLKVMSRWSRSFYAYLAAVCSGCTGGIKDVAVIHDMRAYIVTSQKGSQLEEFLARRFRLFPNEQAALDLVDALFWKMLAYEMLYLWNTLPSCTTENINEILSDCALVWRDRNKEPMVGLSKLVEGACFCIRKEFERGIDSFRNCLSSRKSISKSAEDAHISAFASYELGSLLIKSLDTLAEGKALLSDVSNYHGYDFEAKLNVRVSTLLKTI